MEKELIEALDDLVSELNRTNYDREELDELASWHKRAEEILQKAKDENKQKFLNLVDGKDETFFSDLRDNSQQGGKTPELEANQRTVSDEEIKEEGDLKFHYYGEGEFSEGRALGFLDGAKWMRNKLNK